jgi:hypothetical protein
MEYRIVIGEVKNLFIRDVEKAAADLTEEMNRLMKEGWEPQGGISNILAGTGVYMIQAAVKR